MVGVWYKVRYGEGLWMNKERKNVKLYHVKKCFSSYSINKWYISIILVNGMEYS